MGISPKDYWERRGRMTGEAARRLREARQARGWTQRTLAAQTGVGHGVVSQAERGQLHIADAAFFAEALGITLDWLLRGVGAGPGAAAEPEVA